MNVNSVALARTLFAVLVLWFVVPSHAVAGTVAFIDSSESLSFTDTTGRASGSCVSETCTVTVLAPQGYTLNNFSITVVWLDPGTTNVSDTLCGSFFGFPGQCSSTTTSLTLVFNSDGETPIGSFPGGTFFEDGTLQNTGTINWTSAVAGPVSDNIQFQSDVSDVPEPSSTLLLSGGLILLGLMLRRRWIACRGN